MSVKEKTVTKYHFGEEFYTFKWVLNHFDHMPFIREHPIFGPHLHLGKSIWQILLSKRLREESGRKSIGFRLVKAEDNDVWDSCEYKICLQSKDGQMSIQCVCTQYAGGDDDEPYVYCQTKEDLRNRDAETNVSEDSDDSASDTFVSLEEKLKVKPSQAELDAILGAGDLVVLVDIKYVHMVQDSGEPVEDSPERLMALDLKALLKSRKFSDLTVCARGREFPAHKNILAARASNLDYFLQERKDNCREKLVLDTSESVVEALLSYIYTGEFPESMNEDDYHLLHDTAIKYKVHGLADLCQEALQRNNAKDDATRQCTETETTLLVSVKVEPLEDEVIVVSSESEVVEVSKSPAKVDKNTETVSGDPELQPGELSEVSQETIAE